jgi:hypothetical protein
MHLGTVRNQMGCDPFTEASAASRDQYALSEERGFVV